MKGNTNIEETLMTTLLKNGKVVNVFTNSLMEANVLFDDSGIILGVGDYDSADRVIDCSNKILSPSFIDGHIHIESTMLTPKELAKVCMAHGTGAIIADPHEIANVAGNDGIRYMLEASAGLPMKIFFMLPSCVPATPLDESGAILRARDLDPWYANPRVLGLAEMMNYPGVIHEDVQVLAKIKSALSHGKIVNGHAPLLRGKDLDAYIAKGIYDDHECSSFAEAKERIEKGQWVMIREGTTAHNLEGLIGLFEEPYCYRCLLVADDQHAKDLLGTGHIDHVIRKAVRLGEDPIIGIRMASLQTAQHFGLQGLGAIAPGYKADILVLDSLENVDVRDVYLDVRLVVKDKVTLPFRVREVNGFLRERMLDTIHFEKVRAEDFLVAERPLPARIIDIVPGGLLTNVLLQPLDFSKGNGIDVKNDILKVAVVERHRSTGHIGIGFIHGIGLKRGAIASSCSHDSHNVVAIGMREQDIAFAVNHVKKMRGGFVVVDGGHVLAELPLPLGGIMSEEKAEVVASQNEAVRKASQTLGVPTDIEPFMLMAFMCLSVIPHLKITTLGLVDVDRQALVPLYKED